MERKRVLVVDDDPFIRRVVRHLVEGLGYECMEAGAGEEACQVALSECPDLVVLDVMLPEMNGYEVSRTIKREVLKGTVGKDIKVLIVTARRTDSEEREEFLKTWSQAEEFIYKPFDFDYLSQRITEMVEGEPSQGEAPAEERGEATVAGAEAGHVEEAHPRD